MLNTYYIYLYLDQDDIPFYVGKGKNDRYKVYNHLHKNSPNPFLKNKIRKVGAKNIKIHFLHKNITEEEALQQERYWIKYYGRRDLGTGTLCNLTDGGEIGPTGRKLSEETKQKIGEANKGKPAWNKGGSAWWCKGKPPPIKGKKHTEEAKQKISKALKGKPGHWTGKKLSEEHKRKMSKSHKGQVAWNRGEKMSEETKWKISESIKKRNALKKLGKK